ncbi:unnamed protein product [Dracunculus medinensis]|uniref:PID domain-containing protein n=1 Tax=Dracunculus medinensis TaxID=318479 RepID=A0A158Q2M6_DRAME|nr:unnamed protein product [Dracunculus medinensis]
MSVDYSPCNFQDSLATIDAASRGENIRVHHQGDTTIVTEHRDPYSFYWQLDQVRQHNEDPPRHALPTDYVIDEENIAETVLSPDSHDSGIHIESQYSRPIKVDESQSLLMNPPLPPGWEKHEDPSGYSYYWHIDTGTIQREPPVRNREIQVDVPSAATATQQQLPRQSYQPIIEEHAYKQTTTKRQIDNEFQNDGDYESGKPVRFAIRSLGWTEIAEEDLTTEKSSRAVNKAIVDLSTGRNDIMDNVSKWGDGRELIMEIDDNDLTLIDPDTMAVIHSERIHQIRVWGVGRDNGRDFAYVARDRNSRRFMCHVFRCDTPARTIANTLRDICKKLMLQRRPNTINSLEHKERRIIARDNSLPTPIEEPKKTIRCHFLGVTQVPRATGIEILNEAVDRLLSQVRPDRWILADVSIAPSTITITEVNGNQIAQCRVRYLSFLGIGRDVKHCAFIMHTSSENFMCYVFHVEPSAGPMAKTIEAACKLRYQKVLDAHSNGHLPVNGKRWGDTFWNALGTVKDRFTSRT